jgi:hypothetical protein
MDIYIPVFFSQNNRPIVIYNITTKVDESSSSSFIGELHSFGLPSSFQNQFLETRCKEPYG